VWRLLSVFALLTAVTACFAIQSLHELDRLSPELQANLLEVEARTASMTKAVESSRERAELAAWIQEQMLRVNPRLEKAAATEYAHLLLDATDKYGAVDPVFLLAVGMVESHFDTNATSRVSAKGLYQIYPATGEWLASELGRPYQESMLYEPEINTELAALYLEKLFATYEDPRLVLAEYNGGPINARRFRTGSDLLASETRDYVAKVMGRFRHLSSRLDEHRGADPSGDGGDATLVALTLDDD
jgi:soluble lytic murein transglycosylase-like protein